MRKQRSRSLSHKRSRAGVSREEVSQIVEQLILLHDEKVLQPVIDTMYDSLHKAFGKP